MLIISNSHYFTSTSEDSLETLTYKGDERPLVPLGREKSPPSEANPLSREACDLSLNLKSVSG